MVNNINVEIVYASEQDVTSISLVMESGSSIETAIKRSDILDKYSEIDLKNNKIGIFSDIKSLDDILQEGDRIEIYRPLKIDPKQARRQRALKKPS